MVTNVKTYERIKKRRKDLGLSMNQVAAALSVNRTTVMRYESNSIEKMPISIIPPLAKVLRCSEAYIMGWTDNPNDYLENQKTVESEYINDNYNKLTEEDQRYIADLIKRLVNK